MPPVTGALLAANILVFLLQGAYAQPLFANFALWPPTTGPGAAPGFEFWQLVSYSFLHGGLLHLGFNMLALYTFGRDVERLFGSAWYLQYYFASVVAAALTHLLVTGWMGAPPYPTVGASGGVYGLLLAFGVYFPRRTVILLFPPFHCRRACSWYCSGLWSCISASPERLRAWLTSPTSAACWGAGS